MLSTLLPLFLSISATLAGSYAPPPMVEPSPSAYGSPYTNQQQDETYGYSQQHQALDDAIYKEPVMAELPISVQKTPEPQSFEQPIQVTAAQAVYEYPSTVYNDYDTTTVYTTTATTYAPIADVSEDEEHYGVPEISSPLPFNPLPSDLSAQEAPVVSQPAQLHSYAPPPLVQAAPSAYGAPVPSVEPVSSYGSSSSYDQPQHTELQPTVGEVPAVLPGTPETLPTETYPSRIHRKKIRAQKRFHKKH